MNSEFNDFETEPKKSKTGLIIVAVAVLLVVVLIIALIIVSSPKNTLLRMMKNAQPTVEDAMETLSGEDNSALMNLSRSQQTTIEITDNMGMTDELGGKLVVDIEAGYLTENGDGMIKVVPKLGTLTSFDVGVYMSDSKVGLVSEDVLDQAYVLNTNQDLELDDVVFSDRLMGLLGLPTKDDKQLIKYQEAFINQLKPYLRRMVKDIPNDQISTERKSIDLFGESTKTACIVVTFTDDEFTDYLEPIIEDMLDDDKLLDAYQDLTEYQMEGAEWMYDLMDMDTDDATDLEETLESLLDSLDDAEFDELTFNFYHKGKTPIAVGMYYEDEYTEVDAQLVLYSKGDDAEVSVLIEGGGEEGYISCVKTKGDYVIGMEFPDAIQMEIAMLETKDGYDIEGEMEIEDYGSKYTADISGTVVEDKNLTTMNIEYDFDFDGDKATGTMELTTEEVRKNEEYAIDGEYTIEVDGDEIVISLESEVLFGKNAEIDMASLDKGFEIDLTDDPDDVYDQLDEAAMEIEEAIYEFMWGQYY